jgi:hypothetical protein
MLGHEGEHVEQRALDGIDKISAAEEQAAPLAEVPTDLTAYRNDMAALRKASLDITREDPQVIAAAQEALAAAKVGNNPAGQKEQEIAQAVIDGNFDQMQPTEANPTSMGHLKVNEARLQLPQLEELNDSGLSPDDLDQRTTLQKNAMSKLDIALDSALNKPDSPMAVFDESTYVGAPNEYGHPSSNYAESMASSENILRAYPQKLAERLKTFSTPVRKVLLGLLKRINADTNHAGLQGSFATATKELQDKRNANLEWVEKQVSENK